VTFRVVVPGGFAEAWIDRCLESLLRQTDSDWHAVVVLDRVGDGTVDRARRFAGARVRVVVNDEPRGALGNVVEGVRHHACRDEDVVVTLDADDWLADEHALEIVRAHYARRPDTLVTHGSWLWWPGLRDGVNNRPYTAEEFATNIRRHVFRAGHLQTMKYTLFRRIPDAALRDRHGRYFRSAGDMALMLPALEIAGFERVTFVPERVYVYNRETPYNEDKVRSLEQRAVGLEILRRTPCAAQPDL
jgi:glycosyltransferase involved in cell wall biosynthesis